MPGAPTPTAALDVRARIHGALSDPHRVAIVDALAITDLSPSDLAQLLGIRSNLLAHHLLTLERAGVIEVTPSSGDRRRRYVRLVRDVLAQTQLAFAPLSPRSVLFVCTGNSARSPLAEAYWRLHSDVPVTSAGTHPADRVHPLAVAAGRRAGLDLDATTPRAFDPQVDAPDLLVTVCDEAHEQLPAVTAPWRLHWSIPDPTPSEDERAFDLAITAIRDRIEALIGDLSPAA